MYYHFDNVDYNYHGSTLEMKFEIINVKFTHSKTLCQMPYPKIESYTEIPILIDSTDLIYPCKPQDTIIPNKCLNYTYKTIIHATTTAPISSEPVSTLGIIINRIKNSIHGSTIKKSIFSNPRESKYTTKHVATDSINGKNSIGIRATLGNKPFLSYRDIFAFSFIFLGIIILLLERKRRRKISRQVTNYLYRAKSVTNAV
ncbi:hypothetical protein RF11_03079 [Thelohanellus kitauei]|uniref:Uncharacterized protein n=1 Tax=Thelohanellus kitauei TaxID=669202 RepID=A0A0C2N044_THEKT|nr:hypothetical protein RF11_03079 [Thelohanellus kitauei]